MKRVCFICCSNTHGNFIVCESLKFLPPIHRIKNKKLIHYNKRIELVVNELKIEGGYWHFSGTYNGKTYKQDCSYYLHLDCKLSELPVKCYIYKDV